MRELTYNEAGIEAVAEEMRRDGKIFYMSTDPIGPLAKESATSASARRRSLKARSPAWRSEQPDAASVRSSTGAR